MDDKSLTTLGTYILILEGCPVVACFLEWVNFPWYPPNFSHGEQFAVLQFHFKVQTHSHTHFLLIFKLPSSASSMYPEHARQFSKIRAYSTFQNNSIMGGGENVAARPEASCSLWNVFLPNSMKLVWLLGQEADSWCSHWIPELPGLWLWLRQDLRRGG